MLYSTVWSCPASEQADAIATDARHAEVSAAGSVHVEEPGTEGQSPDLALELR